MIQVINHKASSGLDMTGEMPASCPGNQRRAGLENVDS
jgi:hypothetical protein